MSDPTLENVRLRCAACGKLIEYERPIFCPYCGSKIESSQGLDVDDGKLVIYKWTSVAPTLMSLFLFWTGVTLLLTYFFGRSAFILCSVVLILCVAVFLFLGWLHVHAGDNKRVSDQES